MTKATRSGYRSNLQEEQEVRANQTTWSASLNVLTAGYLHLDLRASSETRVGTDRFKQKTYKLCTKRVPLQ